MATLIDQTKITLELPDEAATAALAGRLATALPAGTAVALRGPLGIGKTVFARAFIRALTGPAEEVPSPSFTLAQTYETPRGTVWHLDLYRLAEPGEAWELGWEEALGGRAILIEWPERLGPLLPARRLDVTLAQGAAPGARTARLEAPPPLLDRFAAAPP